MKFVKKSFLVSGLFLVVSSTGLLGWTVSDGDDRQGLIEAIQNNQLEDVKLFLGRPEYADQDVNEGCLNGESIFSVAVKAGKTEIILWLVEGRGLKVGGAFDTLFVQVKNTFDEIANRHGGNFITRWWWKFRTGLSDQELQEFDSIFEIYKNILTVSGVSEEEKRALINKQHVCIKKLSKKLAEHYSSIVQASL